MKIVFVVEGGVVQSVMCDALDHPVSVYLLDHDECDDDPHAAELNLEINPAEVADIINPGAYVPGSATDEFLRISGAAPSGRDPEADAANGS